MFLIIVYIVTIFMWLALVLTYGEGAINNGSYTLGIVLPSRAKASEEVKEILHQYTVKKRIIHLAGFCTIWPIYFMEDFISLLIVYLFVWFALQMFLHNKLLKHHAWKLYGLKKENGWLDLTTAEQEAGLTDDEDIYWLKGKKNPNKKVGLQNKRVGYGAELNASSKWNYVIIAVIAIVVFGIAAFMLRFDLAEVTMERQDDMILIEAADMGETFSISVVKDITLLEHRPSMSKKNGYNGGKFNFGTFHVTGIGSCEVYVYLHNDYVIEVTTDKDTILFNLETEQKTKEAFDQLRDWIKNTH